jgi:pimeloyl-ACP methyl ester carboxylesterase
MTSEFIEIDGAKLEYARIPGSTPPPLVFLHEGLGSVAMWRDFPAQVAAATGAEAVVYSRRGYGRSAKTAGPRAVDYMNHEAQVVLPQLSDHFGLSRPVLIGHSDGASIALIAAGSGFRASGIVVMAPHVFVEDVTVASIAAARDAYRATDLPQRLGRYHDDPDHAFWRWNDIWLDPAFRSWNIENAVRKIDAPLLIIQGADDEYGTPAQVDAIRRQTHTDCEAVLLESCGHSPQRDQPDRTLRLIRDFVERVRNIGVTSGTA